MLASGLLLLLLSMSGASSVSTSVAPRLDRRVAFTTTDAEDRGSPRNGRPATQLDCAEGSMLTSQGGQSLQVDSLLAGNSWSLIVLSLVNSCRTWLLNATV
jgi:hypothetical protein